MWRGSVTEGMPGVTRAVVPWITGPEAMLGAVSWRVGDTEMLVTPLTVKPEAMLGAAADSAVSAPDAGRRAVDGDARPCRVLPRLESRSSTEPPRRHLWPRDQGCRGSVTPQRPRLPRVSDTAETKAAAGQ